MRQPDGVFLDVPTATPSALDVAPSQGVVALMAPLTREEARILVRLYFEAFTLADASAFAPLLASQARRFELGHTAELGASLERRIHAVDYSHLSVDAAAAYEDLRLVPYEAASPSVRAADAMRAGDVLVNVPVRTEMSGSVRLFGPHLGLVFRREGRAGSWKIAVVDEADGPWG